MQTKLAAGAALVLAIALIAGIVTLSQRDGGGTADRGASTGGERAAVTNGNPKESKVDELKIETLQEGTGEGAKKGDRVTVHYRGTLLNGEQFDASYDRGEPITFELGAGNVIQGWDEGLVGMKEGEKRKLVIPAEMAYGNRAQGSIPANSPLVFEVEMLEVL